MRTEGIYPPGGTVRSWLDLRALENGSQTSHLFSSEPSLTWAELRQGAEDIACRLTGLDIAKGESVALMMPNTRQGILCLLGALYGGFRTAVINLVAGTDAMAYALSHSEAKYVLLGEEQKPLFDKVKAAAKITAVPIVVGSQIDWPDCGAKSSLEPLNPEDHAILMYTSGTTGRPKGVLHSHASLLAGGWTTAIAHALTPSDRALCVLPIYHINGLCVTIMAPLVSGSSVVVCEKFSASRFWASCKEHRATWFSVVPTIISHLLHGEQNPDAETKTCIRFGRSASSALAVETQAAFETRFGIPIVETMGLTETAAQILSNPLPPGLRKIGSPGKAYGNKVAILASDMTHQAVGIEGEIAVQGPNVMIGYFKDDAATASAFTTDGWLRTGDLGRIDADGYVFVTGRLKELIIKGGENIAPREVDEALYSDPDVVEAAAFARPCATYGEKVEAAVKLRDGSKATPISLLHLCESKLGKFKSPDIIHILDDLPKGPSGKIQRMRLAEITK